jgi:hypothetical protein
MSRSKAAGRLESFLARFEQFPKNPAISIALTPASGLGEVERAPAPGK